MEWLKSIRTVIRSLEEHIQDPDYDVYAETAISPFWLQRGFRVMTGYSIAEYVRNRRLYLAALDVLEGRKKIIDLSADWGYETPESFTKAFTRFHGVTPRQLKKEPSKIRVFLPLKVTVTLQGGDEMDYIIEQEKAFSVIGIQREFDAETSYQQIPEFWNEVMRSGKKGNWMWGVCIDDAGKDRFRYLIAETYDGGKVPEGMTVYEFPELTWAKFLCRGPLPGALQSVNTKIFSEWLPQNEQYDLAWPANIEWYSEGDPSSVDYESAIWIPVRKTE